MPTNSAGWYCDVCGELISTPEEGYVIWNVDEEHLDHGFLVIHNGKCDNPKYPSSIALADLVGPDGLSHLMAFLSVGSLRADPDYPTKPSIANIDDFVDLVRRLHVPHYEEARRHFDNGGVREAMSDANEYYPYVGKVMQKIAAGEYDDGL
jgi:hypothetical protein